MRATNVYGARQQLFKIMMRTSIFITKSSYSAWRAGDKELYISATYLKAKRSSWSEGDLAKSIICPEKGSEYGCGRSPCKRDGKRLEDVAEDVEERLGQDAVYEID